MRGLRYQVHKCLYVNGELGISAYQLLVISVRFEKSFK
jgi:hypothetical protein